MEMVPVEELEPMNCPFCDATSYRIECREDSIKDENHIFNGSIYVYARCKTCGCHGPWCYAVDAKTDIEKWNIAISNWNKRDKRG